jgi:predicted Abi (CAAX) family protease
MFMVLFILKRGDPNLLGIGFHGCFLAPSLCLLDFYLALCNKVLYYLSGSMFLIALLSEMVVVHNHGGGCESWVCKQVLSQSN